MRKAVLFTLAHWSRIRLVVFDVDGTLYRQRALRLRMTRELLAYSLSRCDFNVVSVLRKYRHIRERLGNEEAENFERMLISETAKQTRNSPEVVRAIAREWIERRPLPHLANCIYRGVPAVFAGLRRRGKCIGILSDYPASDKLAALGLHADHVVSAGDQGVGVLKPHPRGLEAVLAAAGATAGETLVVGDRIDRDGAVAQRAGAWVLIRSSKPVAGWQSFANFDDPPFAPFLAHGGATDFEP